MPRRGKISKRDVLPDPLYGSKLVTKLVNNIMLDGKKGVAQKIVYDAFAIVEAKVGQNPLETFEAALENVMPVLEVKARRVGGSTYQVPMEVRAERRQTLGLRWLVLFSRKRGEKTMAERLAGEIIVVNIRFHTHQVDDSAEVAFYADRQLDRNGICMEAILHHLDNTIEVRTHNIHFVDISHTRHSVLISLSPNGFRLRFNASLGAKYGYRTVQHAQRALHFNGKVNVAGGINDIDTILFPIAGGCGRGNGDTSLLLLRHPVHRGRAVVGFAQLMRLSGIEQNSFGCCGFTGINVRHDTDISCLLKRIFPRHCF